MRLFLALSVTVLGDALACIGALAAFLASLWVLLAFDAPLLFAFLAAAGVNSAAVWLVMGRLNLRARWRDTVFKLAGYGPAPSHPGRAAPRLRALALMAAIAPVVTLILVVPLAILLAPVIEQSFAVSAAIVIGMELLIGAPTLIGCAYAAYDRACAEFGVDRAPPRGDPDLDEKIRRRMVDDIKNG